MAAASLACAFWPALSSAADVTSRYDDDIRAAVRRYWAGAPDWTWWKAQLYQESRLDSAAVSPAGAAGLAQFMPATWIGISHDLGWEGVNPHTAKYAIAAGAFYMARLRASWTAPRPLMEQHRLAQASYNAGIGNILAAQHACKGAPLWGAIAGCLAGVTGPDHARETISYVEQISHWRGEMNR